MISPSLQNSGDSEEPVKRKPYIPPGAVHMGMPMGCDFNNALKTVCNIG